MIDLIFAVVFVILGMVGVFQVYQIICRLIDFYIQEKGQEHEDEGSLSSPD